MRATGRKPEDFPKPQMVRTPDGRIPYQPWARQQRIENRKNFFNPTELWHLDSNARCLPMGLRRDEPRPAGLLAALDGARGVQKEHRQCR